MNQQWHDQAVSAVYTLLRWAGMINIFVGVFLAWTVMNAGANFAFYMLTLLPAIVGVWQFTKARQLTDRWLINGGLFYGQAILSFVFASWIASILLWIAGHRLQVLASQQQ
ncbi:hypothetical protein [Furfurilactobacillus siliginis]|uniref:Uncharacterized protein n=1 Tax=Furfurilactobacillus siliginis TaxID=348151 RepID=A0A0R2LE29_9LACO|nr:hypothetical protein [Furfurilactobacillus siliginis]KRN97354.1 hypothetical protein IV55_GL000283 [Furfurilactobacillus siliginis]GEK28972.1 hypothetical protein LSI01_12830 [Furfurilactobacillus siliginis]